MRTSIYYCPQCNSDDIEGEEDSWEDNNVYLYVKCYGCGFKWRETFQYVKWEPLKEEAVA